MINPNPNTVTYDVRSDFDNLLMSIHVQKNFADKFTNAEDRPHFYPIKNYQKDMWLVLEKVPMPTLRRTRLEPKDGLKRWL